LEGGSIAKIATSLFHAKYFNILLGGRAERSEGMQLIDSWDCGFKSR
jgi:hypothetical protein